MIRLATCGNGHLRSRAEFGLVVPQMLMSTSPNDEPPWERARLSRPGRVRAALLGETAEAGLECRSCRSIRIADTARLLGVSDDTVRRWVDAGTLPVETDAANRKVVDGAALAAFARKHANAAPDPSDVGRSARNRLVGLVTEVITDKVMAQVEMQCGPHRVVSLMSSEAVRELGLEPGVLAVAVIKSTNVVVETPGGAS